MKSRSELRIINKEEEMPPGFELHPSEVCNALPFGMTQKLKRGWTPCEIFEAPNIWRVRVGDRMALIGERPWSDGGMFMSVFDFKEAALVYW
jgi:hypothetical protein